MAENSKIEWTHHTFNPWRGCTKVSAGCKNCYAETMSKRNPEVLGVWGVNGTRAIAAESYWRQPLKWNAEAAIAGERHRVFCSSLADVFEGSDTMPPTSWDAVDEARDRLFRLIERTPHLDWLLLTKRPENINKMLPIRWCMNNQLPDNVWAGTSVENQAAADIRIPHLLNIRAKVRFLSIEPLLGEVELRNLMLNRGAHCWNCGEFLNGEAGRCVCGAYHKPLIDWVIVGGESGPAARPMHPSWVRNLRDQCVAAEVPFFFKQWGEYLPESQGDSRSGAMHVENGQVWYRTGKKNAGRLLDGREWNQYPRLEERA